MALHFHTDSNGIRISLDAVWLGEDMSIAVSGGDKGHIGAVAVAQPRPSLKNPDKISTSTSVITICGHKEDQLARQIAAKVAKQIHGVVCVCCGIHVHQATARQIGLIIRSVQELVTQLLEVVSKPSIGSKIKTGGRFKPEE